MGRESCEKRKESSSRWHTAKCTINSKQNSPPAAHQPSVLSITPTSGRLNRRAFLDHLQRAHTHLASRHARTSRLTELKRSSSKSSSSKNAGPCPPPPSSILCGLRIAPPPKSKPPPLPPEDALGARGGLEGEENSRFFFFFGGVLSRSRFPTCGRCQQEKERLFSTSSVPLS